MAKITVEADTRAGTLTCSVDGVAIDNVAYVSFHSCMYMDDNMEHKNVVSFSAESKKNESGVRTSTYAQDLSQDTAKAELAKGNTKFLNEDKDIVYFTKSFALEDYLRKCIKKS